MPLIKVHLDSNARDYSEWLNNVAERTQRKLEAKAPIIKRRTKKTVQKHLVKGKGLEEGIYRKSFTINDYSQTKWEICFQVYAKKPHYRLTHLLEDGHKMFLFRWGRGRPTKWGNVGMAFTTTRRRPKGRTHVVKHIKPGQQYAEKQFPKLYDEGINSVLKERMKRIR